MRKPLIRLAFALAILAPLCLTAHYQSTIIGWWRGEAKYKGKYRNYWHQELRAYDHSHFHTKYPPDSRWKFARLEPRWRVFIAKLFPSWIPLRWDTNPPLQDGDPRAIAVLIELLDA